ncbi:MAG: carboxypeptidase-like regulatory domain-containing protein [Bacteroidota bacterium]
MKKIILVSLFVLPFLAQAQGTLGEVIGTVILREDKSIVYGAKVQAESNGTLYRGRTDEFGKFKISAIPPGEYMFSIIYKNDTLKNIPAKVPIDGIDNMGIIEFRATVTTLEVIDITPRIFPKLTYGVTPEIKMDREQISKSPQKFDQKAMISAMSSDIKLTDDGNLVFRGARKGDMIYVIDGVKLTNVVNVPSAAIGGMMVYTGGIPAKYGDTMGGVVVMETLSYFDLYRAWKAQEYRKQN